ncbi:MAG TPA: PASTA domain-containing protein [Kofleriaceae bacterium]|jgi:beta-lactam-binding protein with PASTA domain
MLRVGVVILGLLSACVIQQPGGTTPPPAQAPPPTASASPAPSPSPDPESSESSPPPPQRERQRGDDRVVARSNDAAMVRIPNVENKSLDEAKRALRAAGITGELTVAYEGGEHGNQHVCGTQPSDGQQLAANYDVEIEFCDPDRPAEPPLVGGTEADARRGITALMAKIYPASKYRIELATDPAGRDCASGTVCAIEPRQWYANPTDVITIHVAK